MTLNPCPFCGEGEYYIQKNGEIWQGLKYSNPVSISIKHWCKKQDGQPQQFIEIKGRDIESATNIWNTRIRI